MRYETAVNKLKLDAEKRGQLKLANVEISDKEAVRYGLLTANERAICTAIADAPEDIVGKYKISVITSRKSGFLRDLKRSARRVTQKMGISDLGSSIQITAVKLCDDSDTAEGEVPKTVAIGIARCHMNDIEKYSLGYGVRKALGRAIRGLKIKDDPRWQNKVPVFGESVRLAERK